MKIPDGLDPALAAPMLCAGATVYSPLVQYGAGTDEVKDVGVIGIGGLGHFALLFAKALGCKTTAISHSESKKVRSCLPAMSPSSAPRLPLVHDADPPASP